MNLSKFTSIHAKSPNEPKAVLQARSYNQASFGREQRDPEKFFFNDWKTIFESFQNLGKILDVYNDEIYWWVKELSELHCILGWAKNGKYVYLDDEYYEFSKFENLSDSSFLCSLK
jgi:hypothetical protein